LLVWMTWLWPRLLGLARVVEPDTILRWHRAGFRAYWRSRSRGRPGRPRVSCELRDLIRRMSKENPLWGAPRIHGELVRDCRVDGLQIHGPAPRAAITDLANILAVCVCRRWPRSTTATLVCTDPAPDSGVAGATDRGGIPVEHGADLFGARQ
jgi:hypothetical protein